MSTVISPPTMQEISSMTAAAKLATQRADNYYKQASKAVKDARALEQRLETATRKLEQLHTGIVEQMKTVTTMIQSLRDQNNGLTSNVSLLLTEQEQSVQALDTVLEKLSSMALHPTLVAAAHAGGSNAMSSSNQQQQQQTSSGDNAGEAPASPATATSSSLLSDKSTLYDFVNIDSVEQLKTQADKEISELKKLQTALGTVMHSIEEQYNHLLQSSETLLTRLQDARVQLPQQATSTQQLQRNEVDSMSKIVLTIAEHYDRLQHLLRNPDRMSLSQQDLLDLRNTNNQLQNMINVLNTGLQKIHTYSSDIDTRSRLYHEFYRTAVNFYADLDSISPVIHNKVNQLDVLQSVFSERKLGAEALFVEISDLTTWYNLFHSAYGELLQEITRRTIEHRRQQKIIESYKSEMAQMYTDELQKREQFYEFHGKYLPSYLCPAILEAPVKYNITPEPDTINSRLPIVDLTLSQSLTSQTQQQQQQQQQPPPPNPSTQPTASASNSISNSGTLLERDTKSEPSQTSTPSSTPSTTPSAPPPVSQSQPPMHQRHQSDVSSAPHVLTGRETSVSGTPRDVSNRR